MLQMKINGETYTDPLLFLEDYLDTNFRTWSDQELERINDTVDDVIWYYIEKEEELPDVVFKAMQYTDFISRFQIDSELVEYDIEDTWDTYQYIFHRTDIENSDYYAIGISFSPYEGYFEPSEPCKVIKSTKEVIVWVTEKGDKI